MLRTRDTLLGCYRAEDGESGEGQRWNRGEPIRRAAGWIDSHLTERRIRAYAAIFLAVWVASLSGSIVLGHPPRNVLATPILPDYLNHWTGGRLVLEGATDRLYDVGTQLALQYRVVGESDQLYWFVAPPFAALLYLPFAALPYVPSTLVWTAVSVLLLLGAARLAQPLAPGLSRQHRATLLLIGAAAQPTFELIGSGQDSALNLFLWVAGTRLAVAGRDGPAGVVFALGLHKPQLFFLPPLLFLVGRRWRALAAWALTAGLLGSVSLLLVGSDGVLAWFALLVSPLYRDEVQAGQAWRMQSLPALLAAIAPRQLAPPAEALGLLLGLLLVAGLVRRAVRHSRSDRAREAALWGLACLTTLLASPHLGLYDFILLALPALLLVERANQRPVRLALLAAFGLTWTLAARYALVSAAPWPLTAFGASWTAVPLLWLWLALTRVAERVPRAGRADTRSSPGWFDLRIEHLWPLAALAACFIFALGVINFVADTWWALKMGQLSALAGRPVTDAVLSHAPAEPDAANGQWLAQTVLYLLYAGAGEAGLRLAAGLLMLTTFGLVLATARLGGGSARTSSGAILLAALLGLENLGLRTQVFSYPLFALTVLLLHARYRHPGLLYLLPAIFALWSNLHGAFALGLIVLALYTVDEGLRVALARRNGASEWAMLARLAGVLIASLGAVCINPLGSGIYTYLVAAIAHPAAKDLGVEWQPATIRELSGRALALSGLLLFVALRLSRRPVARLELLLLLVFGYLAVNSLRYIVWWGLVLAPILARHLAAAGWPGRRPVGAPLGRPTRSAVNLALAALIMMVGATAPLWTPSRVDHLQGQRAAAAHAPVEAAEFLAGLPAGGRLYHYQPWSGYLAWRLWPRQQPMLDVRFEALQFVVWTDHLAIELPRTDWEALLARYEVDYLVLEPRAQNRLVALAESSGRWTRLYEDETACVLGRRWTTVPDAV